MAPQLTFTVFGRAKSGTISTSGETRAVAARQSRSRRRRSGRTTVSASSAAFADPGWSTTGEFTSNSEGTAAISAARMPSPPKL